MMYGLGRFAYGNGMSWLSWIGPIASFLLWALFAAAMITLIVYLVRHARRGAPASSAIGILEERYARGEITREEFLDRKKDLR